MKKNEDLSRGRSIKADIYSRSNSISGRYGAGQLGLDDLSEIKDDDIFFLETLKMKADLADKMIEEAELQGKDTKDYDVMKRLGEEINDLCTPVHKMESVMTAIIASLQLMVYYGVAIGIWGIVFGKSFLLFSFYGAIAGLLISSLSTAPVIASQRTREKIKDMAFASSSLLGNLGIAIGVVGLVALSARIILF